LQQVQLKLSEKEIKCRCEHFGRFGILCRHALKILIRKDFQEIPEQYILSGWRKDVISSNYQLSRDRFEENDSEVSRLVNEAYLNFESCLDSVRNNKEELTKFFRKTEILKIEFKSDSSTLVPNKDKDKEIIEELISASIPDNIEINVPDVQNNKGCGKKRLIGEVEKQVLAAKKKTRICSACGKREPHNARTCPNRINQ